MGCRPFHIKANPNQYTFIVTNTIFVAYSRVLIGALLLQDQTEQVEKPSFDKLKMSSTGSG
jgi:hypothetical protein